jgi:hypothetical protein
MEERYPARPASRWATARLFPEARVSVWVRARHPLAVGQGLLE